jgi:hypothetical protein
LEDLELIRKDSRGDYYDLCGVCLSSVYACEAEDDNFFDNIRGTLLTPEADYDTLY